jgi:hypothetical protein
MILYSLQLELPPLYYYSYSYFMQQPSISSARDSYSHALRYPTTARRNNTNWVSSRATRNSSSSSSMHCDMTSSYPTATTTLNCSTLSTTTNSPYPLVSPQPIHTILSYSTSKQIPPLPPYSV